MLWSLCPLVAKELYRYDIQITALSETHFTGKCHFTEHGSGFKFFWSCHGADECHVSGVGFAVRTPLIPRLLSLAKGINDCLMTLWLPLSDKKQLTFISAYAPTMTSPEKVKKRFYDAQSTLIKSMPRHEKLIFLGNFNARVGTDYKTWSNVIGKMVWESAIAMGCCSFNLVPSMACWLQAHSFTCTFTTRHHGCSLSLSTGIWLTMSLQEGEIFRMLGSLRPCVMLNAGLITDSS